ncbi:MAG: ribonuclease HII, partial [Chloroflexota bacterium]
MPDLSLERRIYQRGLRLVAGVDEAGRGPLAGPVVAGAVILPPGLSGAEPWLALIDDSKRLSAANREKAVSAVREHALAVGVGWAGPEEIDEIGVGQATIKAMMRAVARLPVRPEHLLLDFVPLRECPFPFETVVRGDGLSYSIAAASNVAKVTRDRWMLEADARFPAYSFARNKGYPTPH